MRLLNTDGFRDTCLDNEDIWDNVPCGLQLVSSLARVCITAARQACLPWGPVGWPTVRLALGPSSLHVWRESSTSRSAPQDGVAPTSYCFHSLCPGLFLCVHTTLLCFSVPFCLPRSLLPPAHPAAPPPNSLSSAVCFMREITRPACQQLPCKSYLQKEEGMGRKAGGGERQ